MARALIVGTERRAYADKATGELKEYRAVHVVWQDKAKDGLRGSMVESISAPKGIDLESLELNTVYRLYFGTMGRYARLEEIEKVGKSNDRG